MHLIKTQTLAKLIQIYDSPKQTNSFCPIKQNWKKKWTRIVNNFFMFHSLLVLLSHSIYKCDKHFASMSMHANININCKKCDPHFSNRYEMRN